MVCFLSYLAFAAVADECASSNMLYPKEDRLNSTLMFACRTCQFSEPAPSSCVYRNQLSNTVGETAGVTQDVGSDPTVGVTKSLNDEVPFCTLCGSLLFSTSEEDDEHRRAKPRRQIVQKTFIVVEEQTIGEDDYDEEVLVEKQS